MTTLIQQALKRLDLKAAERTVIDLISIPGGSGQEEAVARRIIELLKAAGAPPADIGFDNANKKSPLGGQTGNLIFKMKGTLKAPRRMLCGHIDTVPICVGAKPVKRGGRIISTAPKTGLGGDNRAGAAAILIAALEILRRKLPHPPLTFFWPVQEEVGLFGARHVDLKKLGKPEMAFNFDGSNLDLTLGATGAYRLFIEIAGIASHAGVRPAEGVSAIAIAGLAIADLQLNGWHGLVVKGKNRGTSNIGVIQGGQATNVVTDELTLRAEARSHSPVFRKRIVAEYEKAFARAVRAVRNVAGQTGQVRLVSRMDYESFRISEKSPVVVAAGRAVAAAGHAPRLKIADGGLDANWLNAHGIPTVTLGAGQRDIHTIREWLDLPDFHKGCQAALALAMGV